MDQEHRNDLPLMSNSGDLLVHHYALDLSCDFEAQKMTGDITLFLSQTRDKDGGAKGNSQIFSMKDFHPDVTPNKSQLENDKSAELTSDNFKLVLDCKDLEIHCVEELILAREAEFEVCSLLQKRRELCTISSKLRDVGKCELLFRTEEWCVRIWKTGVKSNISFPSIIRISYSTIPQGNSLRWVRDQDGR